METIIENRSGLNLRQRMQELANYRELIWSLAWRDFRVKYAQTVLGLLWAVIEPLATAVLLSIVFNRIARANTFGIDPVLFGLTGMIAWNYFSNAVQQGSESL
ncbi:ABC transporter permease, partial [Arthrospira platensis SPKY1]|nr:ABC transporter permease [Arthrospira platensis SPKY1]